jgi:hypothetical protein
MKRELLLLLLFFAASLPARAETGLALAPMRIEIQIPAGGQYTDTLRLSNDSDGLSRVRAELLDWYLDETLTPQFSDYYEQEKSYSCREWLQLNPREMEMLEGGALAVRYTIRVPANVPPGEYHCGAGFVTLPPVQPAEIPMGMHIAVRAVSAIYVVVGGASSQPAFKDLTLRSGAEGWEAVALFENQGLRTYRVQGFIELSDSKGQVVERVEYPYMPVLPKRQQLFPVRLKSNPAPGTYTLRSHADVGLPEILEATAQVVIPAAMQAAASPAAPTAAKPGAAPVRPVVASTAAPSSAGNRTQTK